MGTVRRKRANRNPNKKVSRSQKNKNKVSFDGAHPLIQQTWDKKKTLLQNYEEMGLVVKLNGVSGGTGREAAHRAQEMQKLEELKDKVEWRKLDDMPAKPNPAPSKEEENGIFAPIEGHIKTDSRATLIGQKVNLKAPQANESKQTKIIEQLEEESKLTAPVIRHQSEQEAYVFEQLLRKHGDNYEAMAKDIKLNKYQLTAGQLKKKMRKVIAKPI
ncbi:Nucleolar protein 16 [Boothiomyces sp. JEL0866]|nr:Nucleolar protein 16 [Boothiomyces sp. JEL0866]KAJ3322469.1 Nucleolar protein 16 [Boothiomyces sp. JEL0866]